MDRVRRGAMSNSSGEEEEMLGMVQPDRTVKVEMEAAEALADLAQRAVIGSGSCSGGEVEERATKRVKTESPLSDFGLNPVDSVPSCPDLAQDSAVLSWPQHEMPCMMISHAKSDQCTQPSDQGHICTRNYTSLGGGRSRQNLSEAEKEAKRLRRVLANRESARRTIRRRQALCEELTRKSIELSEENEKLKKGKEEALREFQSLETKNKHLKAEMAKAANCKVVGTTKPKPGQTETPTSLLNLPMLLPNTLLAPCVWPPIFQSPDISHPYQVPPAFSFEPAKVASQASCKPDQPHKQSLLSFSGPRNPVYILPYPMIFNLSNQGYHCESSQFPKSVKDEEPVDDQDGAATSSKTAESSGKEEPVLPALVEPEGGPSTTRARLLNDLNEIPMESPLDLYEQHVGLHCTEVNSEPEQSNSTGVDIAEHESALCSNLIKKTNDVEVPLLAGPSALTEKEHRESFSSSSDRKRAGAIAAAEARRRRKELTKLKTMHGWQCRTHC